MRHVLLSGVALLASIQIAAAGAMVNTQGEGVMLTHGTEFQKIDGDRSVEAGDLVSINRSSRGRAELVYDDKCTVRLKPGDAVRVNKISPCCYKIIKDGAPVLKDPNDQLCGGSATQTIDASELMGALGAGVLGTAAGFGIYSVTRPVNPPPTIPIVPPTCASAGC